MIDKQPADSTDVLLLAMLQRGSNVAASLTCYSNTHPNINPNPNLIPNRPIKPNSRFSDGSTLLQPTMWTHYSAT